MRGERVGDPTRAVLGVVLALEKDASVGEEFTLGGAAVFRWEEHVPLFAERYGLESVDARLPEWSFLELDLGKIMGLLGYEPRHDVGSVVEMAERMFRGEETGMVRTGGGLAVGGDVSTIPMVNPG